jgi:hypothetical protein
MLSISHFSIDIHGLKHKLMRYGRLAVFGLLPVSLVASQMTSCNLIGAAVGVGLVKLQFGCLPEGSRIDTPSGPIAIEDLKAGDHVTGFNGSPVRIAQIHQYAEDPELSRYLTIHFANGATVSASPRHRIDGIPASMLLPGDACGGTHVVRVAPLTRVARSFDLLTSDAGYRISGIPVNSMIEEMLAARR